MKNVLLISSVFASFLILAACSKTGAATIDQNPSNEANEYAASSSVVDARIITMSVTNFQFAPNVIMLKKGEKVVVRLTDGEGIHSFLSQDLAINQKMHPGETVDIVIPTDTAGTFSFRCGVPCGPGHRDMTGTIVVQ